MHGLILAAGTLVSLFLCANLNAGSSTALDSPVRLDPAFEFNGLNNGTLPNPGQTEAIAHFTRPDGGSLAIRKIADVASCPANTDCLRVLKLRADGSTDESVNSNIASQINFARLTASGTTISTVSGAAVDASGRVVIVGATQLSGNDTRMRVVRITNTGFPDTSFSGDGISDIDFDSASFVGGADNANAVAIDAQGGIVVVGRTQLSNTDFDFAIARLKDDGTLDPSFSNDGKSAIFFDLASTNNIDIAHAVAISADGKITVAGSANDDSVGGRRIALARLTASGNLDSAFCPAASCNANSPYNAINSGIRVGYYFALSASQNDDVRAMAINQGTGNLVIAGTSTNSGDEFGFVQTFNSAGLLTQETGTDGAAGGAGLVVRIGSVLWTPPQNIFSQIILYGASGPSSGPQAQRFFSQRLSSTLSPLGWGNAGTNNSVFRWSAGQSSQATGDYLGSNPGIASIDTSLRLYTSGGFRLSSSTAARSFTLSRLSSPQRVFRDGFEN